MEKIREKTIIKLRNLKDETGTTLIEIIVVIVITSLLAGVFAETLVSSIQIYHDHNVRSTLHEDFRRAFEMTSHDLREIDSTYIAISSSQLLFRKFGRIERTSWPYGVYFDNHLIGYVFDGDSFDYRNSASGNWGTQYPLVNQGIDNGSSEFTATTEGGIVRFSIYARAVLNGKTMKMRTTVFPRMQGRK